MLLSKLIIIGFFGSVIAMFRFGTYCRLLYSPKRRLEPEEEERYQAGARRWLAATGILLGMSVLLIFAGIIWSIIAR